MKQKIFGGTVVLILLLAMVFVGGVKKELVPRSQIEFQAPIMSDDVLVDEREKGWEKNDLEKEQMKTSQLAAPDSLAKRLKEEIDLDLQQIKHRRYVETLNDSRANAAEKEEALKFMGAYLEKLTRYMKIRNQQIQAMVEQNNG